MKRLAFLLGLLSPAVAFAQLGDLATTDDGGQLYFSTLLGLKDTAFFAHEKIMRWSPDQGFEIFAQRPNLGQQDDHLSNPYSLRYPNVTGDGSTVSYVAAQDCYPRLKYIGCVVPNPPQTTIVHEGREVSLEPRLQLNGNAAFALQYPVDFLSPYALVDLVAGVSTELPGGASVGDRQALTLDGRVAFILAGVIHLWSPRIFRILGRPSSLPRTHVFNVDPSSGKLPVIPKE